MNHCQNKEKDGDTGESPRTKDSQRKGEDQGWYTLVGGENLRRKGSDSREATTKEAERLGIRRRQSWYTLTKKAKLKKERKEGNRQGSRHTLRRRERRNMQACQCEKRL